MNEKLEPQKLDRDEMVNRIAEAIREPAGPVETPPVQKSEEIEAERIRIANKIEDETKKLNDARSRLGFLPTDRSNAIDALRKKQEALSGMPTTNERETARLLLNENSEKLFRLGSVFQKRIENNYAMLLDKPETAHIMQDAQVLNGFQSFNETSREKIGNALKRITSVLEKYGSYRNSGALRDDTDNVRTIAIYANKAAQSARALEGYLQKTQSDDAQEIMRAASRLATELDRVRDASGKRASMLNEYLRR